MNFNEAVEEACKKPTLVDALTYICVWESERVVKYTKEFPDEQWESCFHYCINNVIQKYNS